MDTYRDQDYLLNSQYKDATQLNARIDLHKRFSTNPQGWHQWVFEQFQIPEDSTVVELGCGPGLLWFTNRERIPDGWRITLTDFSPGMVETARQRLGTERFSYQVADAQALPFPDSHFDAVIANHMLYHVPDLPRALGEVRRVLKPAGRFYASTLGHEYMHELDELIRRFWSPASRPGLEERLPFTLENGEEHLSPFFPKVVLHRYSDILKVTEAEPLVAYVFSGTGRLSSTDEQRAPFLNMVRQELAARGGIISITNTSGLFDAQKI